MSAFVPKYKVLNTMSKSVDAIVIGSGLGGLSAAALLSHAGIRVLVLERNASFGGAATTYHRGDLTIEASSHETTPPWALGDPKRELFQQLELDDDIELVAVPNFQEIRWKGLGTPFNLPHGFEHIAAALIDRFPKDQDGIKALLSDVRHTLHLLEFSDPQHGLFWKIRHAAELPLDLWQGIRHIRSSLSQVFEHFFGDNEAIKIALCANLAYYSDDPDDFWWMAFAIAQGGFMQAGGHYIRGGSQRLTDQLVDKIRKGGGTVLASSPATRIDLGSDGAVAAVHYQNGLKGDEVTVSTRNVFANAAPHVLQTMLPEIKRPEFMERFGGRQLSISLISAPLGLDRPAAEFGVTSYSTMLVPDWVEGFSDFSQGTSLFGADPNGRLPVMCVVDYGQIDSGLSDDGLHSMNIVCADSLANWEGLSDAVYYARREAWLEAFIVRLDAEWPGLAGAIAASSIATARTMHEHLNTPAGAIYGFAMVPPARLWKDFGNHPLMPDSGDSAGRSEGALPPPTPHCAASIVSLTSGENTVFRQSPFRKGCSSLS